MPEPGLRERKKQRTRRALVAAAARLFAAQGYDRTTVSEIAAAAEVSPRTFFGYFASKEDVLFADMAVRIRTARSVVTDRRPSEPVDQLLLRVVGAVTGSEAFTADFGGDHAAARLRLLADSPALQAAAVRRLLEFQQALAGALVTEYPDELDEPAAAAVVGALLGALLGAAMVGLRRGDDLATLRQEVERAAGVAVRGIAAPVAAPVAPPDRQASRRGLRTSPPSHHS
jgi:AcrR family transcriptional regulator